MIPFGQPLSEVGKAAGHRLADARALLTSERWRGAMYLAGYAVECRLKAKLMTKYRCANLGDLEAKLKRRGELADADNIRTHSLRILLRLTGRLQILQNDTVLSGRFTTVNRWVVAWRYTANPSSRDEATDFVDAAGELLRWLDHNV